MEKKKHQKALSVEEQIENLKAMGLLIEDENGAKEVLSNISYYRLIKAYGIKFKKKKNDDFIVGTKFNTLVDLYNFNSEFSHLLFGMIEKVEVTLRCRISNYFSLKYGVLGYNNKGNFDNESYYNDFIDDIKIELERNEKSPFVKNFKDNYENGELPLYALIELFSFGLLSKFYKNMHSKDKKVIAKEYNVPYIFLESWLESLSFVRNSCAHYGRLYNERLPKKPMLYKEDKIEGTDNDRVFTAIKCLSRLIKHDSSWDAFKKDLKVLFNKYKNINITLMGFPKDWYNFI